MADKHYDVVLFGATGFTGRLTAEYLARSTAAKTLRWALAGRNRAKLEQVRAGLAPRAHAPDILLAEASDEAQLRALVRSTRVVISTVGPYLRYGEPLVRACASEGTDYVDLTGEWVFVDQMIERYHELAARNRARIVHSCGFDSIPYDLGTLYTLKRLARRAGPLDNFPVTVECFVRANGRISGGTWHSGLEIMADLIEHEKGKAARRAKLPRVGEGRVVKELPHRVRRRNDVGMWTLPMLSIDPQVVCRSALLTPGYGHDFRYGQFIALPNLIQTVGATVGVSALFLLAQFSLTRNLLLKLLAPGEGPSPETRKNGWFHVVLLGHAASYAVRCEVSGGDPGYDETAKMLAESALCLAFDRERLPANYGIVPPAAAMGEALLERLIAAGIRFEDKSADVRRVPLHDATRDERAHSSKAN